jgi:MFS family permease
VAATAETKQGQTSGWTANARWNFLVLGADVAFFTFGLNISSAYVVLPLFVHQLTPDNTAVALIAAVRALGLYAPQLLVAPLVERRRHALPFLLRMTVFERVPYLVLALGALWLARGQPTLLLVLFFAMLFIALAGGGVTFPAWLDLIARAMPRNWMGRFLGFWQGIGGLLGIGGATLAAVILANVSWPFNFALCFILTFSAMIVSFVLLALGREPPRTLVSDTLESDALVSETLPSAEQEARVEALVGEAGGAAPGGWPLVAGFRDQARAFVQILRDDRGLVRLLSVNALTGFATMASALFAVSALKLGGLTNAEAGAETTVLVVASTGGNFLWGALGDARGHRQVLAYGAACAGLAALIAIWAHGFAAYGLVFLLMGLNLASTFLAGLTFIAEFGPEVKRPTYSALSAVAFAPFAIGTPLLAGWLADAWGYRVVFVVSAFAGLLATIGFLVFVPDPKRRDRAHATP